jgi:hypothetical protein
MQEFRQKHEKINPALVNDVGGLDLPAFLIRIISKGVTYVRTFKMVQNQEKKGKRRYGTR